MDIGLVTFDEYKELHGSMDRKTFDNVVEAVKEQEWTQEQYREASREISSLGMGVPNPGDVIVYAAIKEKINAEGSDPFPILIETYLVQGKSEDPTEKESLMEGGMIIPENIRKYIVPSTLPIRRRRSSLSYNVPPDINEQLLSYISDAFSLPVIGFEDLMEAHEKGTLRDKLDEYRGKEVIVKNAYASTDKHKSEQTTDVYRFMKEYKEDPKSPTLFYIFSDPNNPGLEEKINDGSHPLFNMFDFNVIVDLSNI